MLKKRDYKADMKLTAQEKWEARKRYSIATQYTKRVDPPLYFYVLESWNQIDYQQRIFDQTVEEVEKIRLRNLITQQKARMYVRIRRELDASMLVNFHRNTKKLFNIIDMVLT